MLPAGGLSLLPVLAGRHVDPLALDGLDHEGGNVTFLELSAQGAGFTKRDRAAPGQQVAETVAELLPAIEGQGSRGEAVKGVLRVKHPRTARRLPGEFQSRLYRFRARVAEEDAVDALGGAFYQLLSQQPGEESAVHLDHVGQVEVKGSVERRLDGRVAPPQGIHAETREEVEVGLPNLVVEVATVGPDIKPVETNRFEDPHQLVVQVLLVEDKVLPVTAPQKGLQVKWHGSGWRSVPDHAGGRRRR